MLLDCCVRRFTLRIAEPWSRVHTGHSHAPIGASVRPTQPKWNHSNAHCGLSQQTISPNEMRPHEQNVSSVSGSCVPLVFITG